MQTLTLTPWQDTSLGELRAGLANLRLELSEKNKTNLHSRSVLRF